MPRLMADVSETITSFHKVLLSAVSPHGSRSADGLFEVRVHGRLLLGIHPLQRNGAGAVYSLYIANIASRSVRGWLSDFQPSICPLSTPFPFPITFH